MSILALIGWGFLLSSWIVPYIMRKRATTFEQRQKSYNVGMLLSAIALVIFVGDLIIHFIK
jgi:hypothetical protein